MKNLFKLSLLSGCLCLLSVAVNAQEISCILKGKVVGRDSKNLLLHKITADTRNNPVVIPIEQDAFEYKLVLPVAEAYKLIFEDEYGKGIWRPIEFMAENGEVNFVLHPIEEHHTNIIKGGKLNQEYQAFQKTFRETFEPLASPIYDSLKVLRNKGEGEGPQAIALEKEMEALGKKAEAWKNNHIENNPSLVTYFLFMEDLLQKEYSNDAIRYRYSLLAKKYPNHPYTRLAANKIESLEQIRVGGRYIDFSAADLNGKAVTLSKVLDNEVTLIDLWASWCGPCIRTSRTMIPLYEEFKGKGFSVVSIAREFKNTTAMQRIIEREKFPWLNLVELDDKNEIWHKYNLSFSGGGTVLVDKQGNILAIDPTANEVREVLQKKLLK